ncbi:MAG TPA: nucleotide exchange factor GrpE [Terriglobia bacterium]|nr:nucleotide exchange factor GrpE [Terriglobia bacterium]
MTDSILSPNNCSSGSPTESNDSPLPTPETEASSQSVPASPEVVGSQVLTSLESTPSTTPEGAHPGIREEAEAATTGELQPARAPVPFEEFETLQRQNDELFERFLRKQAEFENFRKRTEKEKQEFLEYVLFHFIKDLLPVLDSLERSLNAPDGESVEDHKKGIELVLKQLREILSTAGLQPIRSLGRLFDPYHHQAMLREENDRYAENEVIEELQRGYIFKDRLLRPSLVKVAVAPSPGLPSQNPIETKAQ